MVGPDSGQRGASVDEILSEHQPQSLPAAVPKQVLGVVERATQGSGK